MYLTLLNVDIMVVRDIESEYYSKIRNIDVDMALPYRSDDI